MHVVIKWKKVAGFFVPGTPKPQPRPRLGGRHVYNPGTADAWKGLIVVLGNRHKPRKPLEGPVRVDIVFLFDHHASSKSRAASHPHRTPHIGVPDRDNLDKAVLDAMARAQWYGNDCQVCHGTIEKWWKADNERSGAEITVSVPA